MPPAQPISQDARSLAEVHGSVGTGQISFWRRMFAFAGPAYLVSVGYMDPGNWATDLEGGARFGYRLLWVLVMSNAMAILLQTLSARLGIVSGRDLAQACRETYPRSINVALWGLCEIAIAACDLAEVLGAAIGLNLLFHIPLLAGVLITAADTLLILWLQSVGIRTIEAFVLALIAVIAACFFIEILWAHPSAHAMLTGLVPRLNRRQPLRRHRDSRRHGDAAQPLSALGPGADAPHRPQRRRQAHGVPLQPGRFGGGAQRRAAGERRHSHHGRRRVLPAPHHRHRDSAGAGVADPVAGHQLRRDSCLPWRCSVPANPPRLTGTLAGQVVVEGFLNFRMRPWLRRLITRTMAITPAALTIYFAGEQSTFQLIILSQVILSLQLPFAIIPLIHFTNDRARMGAFANPMWVRMLAWTTAVVIVGLNLRLAVMAIADWLAQAGPWRTLILAISVVGWGHAPVSAVLGHDGTSGRALDAAFRPCSR